jgi:hypothetical protein
MDPYIDCRKYTGITRTWCEETNPLKLHFILPWVPSLMLLQI